jgi:protein-disulfide isomerase
VAALLVGLMLLATGCSRQVSGTAKLDPVGPTITMSDDGFGIVAGFPDAPVQIEIYTEPQCSHCADLQRDFGEEFIDYINLGQLAITYRPLTFLDDRPDGYSARIANALFIAAQPAGSPEAPSGVSAVAFQKWVEELWANQATDGRGPSNDEIADMAAKSGLPKETVAAIGQGDEAVNVTDMEDTNFEYLFEIDMIDTGTPTVFDLKSNEKLDIYDNNWLSKVMAAA